MSDAEKAAAAEVSALSPEEAQAALEGLKSSASFMAKFMDGHATGNRQARAAWDALHRRAAEPAESKK